MADTPPRRRGLSLAPNVMGARAMPTSVSVSVGVFMCLCLHPFPYDNMSVSAPMSMCLCLCPPPSLWANKAYGSVGHIHCLRVCVQASMSALFVRFPGCEIWHSGGSQAPCWAAVCICRRSTSVMTSPFSARSISVSSSGLCPASSSGEYPLLRFRGAAVRTMARLGRSKVNIGTKERLSRGTNPSVCLGDTL